MDILYVIATLPYKKEICKFLAEKGICKAVSWIYGKIKTPPIEKAYKEALKKWNTHHYVKGYYKEHRFDTLEDFSKYVMSMVDMHGDENMEELKETIAEQEDGDLWTASLYGQWLNTLRPLLKEKGNGYPIFMQSDEWNKKSLEGFLGSYAELKHDTILYAKQAMAEMGGGWEEDIDDRGYVEPEPVIYSRFAVLAESTANGLMGYGMLDKNDKENLEHMAELAKKLVVISEKELRDETLSDEEYDLIRDFGGDLEHLWADATKEDNGEYPSTLEHPGAIIADVATDPNGSVLEIGTGHADNIYVICQVAGKLKVCRGSVYSFYEFPWPMNDRLTDKEWRIKIGVWPETGYEYNIDESIKQPEWTQGYRAGYAWD